MKRLTALQAFARVKWALPPGFDPEILCILEEAANITDDLSHQVSEGLDEPVLIDGSELESILAMKARLEACLREESDEELQRWAHTFSLCLPGDPDAYEALLREGRPGALVQIALVLRDASRVQLALKGHQAKPEARRSVQKKAPSH